MDLHVHAPCTVDFKAKIFQVYFHTKSTQKCKYVKTFDYVATSKQMQNHFEKNSPYAFPSLNSRELHGIWSVLMADQVGQCVACHNKPRPHQAGEKGRWRRWITHCEQGRSTAQPRTTNDTEECSNTPQVPFSNAFIWFGPKSKRQQGMLTRSTRSLYLYVCLLYCKQNLIEEHLCPQLCM